MPVTFNKSSQLPLSIGPVRRPSSSIKCGPSVDDTCTKHVKWRSVSRFWGISVWPADATCAWMFAKSGVVSRIWARCSGVLSVKDSFQLFNSSVGFNSSCPPLHSSANFWRGLPTSNVKSDWRNTLWGYESYRRGYRRSYVEQRMEQADRATCIRDL